MRESNLNSQKSILLLQNGVVESTEFAERIKQCGYGVVNAFGGRNIIETIKSRLPEIDLIIVDSDMVLNQLAGKSVLDILRYFDMPVLFLSNQSYPIQNLSYDQESDYRIMSKSSSVSMLNDSIQKALNVYQSQENSRNISNEGPSKEQIKSESHYREIFESASEGILILDATTGRVKDINSSMARMAGVQKHEIIGKTFHQIRFFRKLEIEENFQNEILLQNSVVYKNRRAELPNGEKIQVSIEGIAYHLQGRPMIRCVVREASRHMAKVQRLESELEKKKVMLQELQHRTKNTFAMISGLVELKSLSSESEESQQMLQELTMRVQSIAELYQLLYENDSGDTVNMANYCSVISESIIGVTRNVSVRQNIDEIQLSTKKATSLGLILVELLYNVMKYAFPDKKKGGRVEVDMIRKKAGLQLKVSDNGVGLPKDFKVKKSHSSGLHLVQMLADQLNGKVTITSKEGTTVQVDLKN